MSSSRHRTGRPSRPDSPPAPAVGVDRSPDSEERESFRVRPYQLLVASTLCLLVVGLVMVFSVSSAVGFFREDGDLLFYLRQQGLIALAGLVAMVVISRVDYRRWRLLTPLAVLGACVLLVLVHVPGIGREAGGATRWLDLGPLPLQPSEVAKLAIVMLGAHLLATKKARSGRFEDIAWPLGGFVIVVCLLILWQRDLGTALVVGVVTMGLFWVAGMRLYEWMALGVAGIALTLVAIFVEDYRRERFMAFLHPFDDVRDSGFQIVQSFLAMGSGGWFGVGPGLSVQKFSYLPEAHTDMILAVLGEEFGLVGVGVVVLLFAVFAGAGLVIARRCADPFGRFLVAGCTFLVAGQAAVNMGGVMGALPLTGIPLPFISYGRTNLLVVLVAVGIMLSVARFGPVIVTVPAAVRPERREQANVTYIDSRRRYRGSRGARVGHS
ncbi:MAG: putative lipid II flippase FtsW [Thermoleophilia bacterium]